jgi:hypothetical protein
MSKEPSGEYYDYTKTMKPERPWLVPWHQSLVYRIMHALRNGEGDLDELFLTFEQGLVVIKRLHNLTCGVPQIVFLTGWQFEGHDSKYPSWAEANRHLKRAEDKTALDSLRWLIREARRYNCKATLHLNVFDAYQDSPLWDEYVEKDIIAKDKQGNPIKGNVWSGMDCYHVSYAQEWKHGMAQKRVDDIIAMVPEIQENNCVYLDAFLGARKDDQQGPISPYLEFTKEDEAATMRKIFRYWRDREIDCASEWVIGMKVDRYVGLQPYSAAQGELIEDLPDELYTTGPVYYEFREESEPDDFYERFCLKFLPWFYKNSPNAQGDRQMVDGTDVFVPALWCDEKTIIAYSKEGYESKTWELPPDWRGVEKVGLAVLSGEEPRPIGEIDVIDGSVTLRLKPDEAVRVQEKTE